MPNDRWPSTRRRTTRHDGRYRRRSNAAICWSRDGELGKAIVVYGTVLGNGFKSEELEGRTWKQVRELWEPRRAKSIARRGCSST